MYRFHLSMFLTLLIALTAASSPLSAEAQIYDGLDSDEFISTGSDILTVDYIGLWDNEVAETGTDYPYGRIWLVLYPPEPYAKQDVMEEDGWNRADELARYEIPGPSSTDRWADGDEVIFTHLGIYEWGGNIYDSVVFRVIVEEPDDANAVDTIIWGLLFEDDTRETDYEFRTDTISIYFRTTNLPGRFSVPSAVFNEIWIEHAVEVGGYDGILVHTKFQVDNLRASTCRIAGFVHYDNNNESVPSQLDDAAYRTPSGNLTIQRDFIPIYPSTLFSDMTLFIPYDAFPISDDFVDYNISLEILDSDWNYVHSDTSPVFSVRKPS